MLNVTSKYDVLELQKVRQRSLDHELDRPPHLAEVKRAMWKLKSGKAARSSGILPEMVKAGRGDDDFLGMMCDLVSTVWEERRVPKEWVDAILIPIPKKGDLRSCDNWRGISLLEVVGKVVARVIQQRLQRLAERELPDSQCGFRKGRGCTDMTFVVKQLAEKAVEHRAKQFFIFVDLRKAYDSVSREALWEVLGKLGVPERMIEIIKSFHHNMEASIRVDEELLDRIEVKNGLRQGCTLAPTLFNLYACVVIERWLEKVREVEGVGTKVLYKFDQQLFRRSTRGANHHLMTECQFADDVALLATSREAAEEAIRSYQLTAKAFGLTLSTTKTKFMVVGHGVTEEEKLPITVEGGMVEHVEHFQYLGSLISENGQIDAEIDRRIAGASRAFGALNRAVFRDRNLSVNTKRLVYQACVMSVLLYGSECWTPLKRHLKRLNSFHHRCVRIALGISQRSQWEERISARCLRERWGDEETVSSKVMIRRLEWLGHLARMPDERMPKTALFSWLPKTRPRCGPKDGGEMWSRRT